MGKQSDYEAQWERHVRAVGLALLRLARENDPDQGGPVHVDDVRFKLDADGGTSVLAIVKGGRGEERLIAFVGGLDLATTMLALARKIEAGGLRWRTDVPWGE